MKTLSTLELKVTAILEAEPATRDSDKELALKIWEKFYRINPYAPVSDVLRNNRIPSIESLGRVRRKVQETREDLRGKNDKRRIEAQRDFISYATESEI